jgi:hypothetical protein
MQGFSVESNTSRICSSRTLWQDLEAHTSHAMKQTWLQEARDSTREDDKLWGPNQKSTESCVTRSYVQFGEKLMTRAYMQKGEGSTRLENRHHAKEAGNWAWMGPDRPAQPSPGTICPLLWPSCHSCYFLSLGREPHINQFVIGRGGAEKRGTASREERVELVD